VLVDQLWPRGVSKARAAIDAWMKDIAPSAELRQWFGHDPARWKAFERRYHAELKTKQSRVVELLERADGKRLTLVYAAKDSQHNNAVALRSFLEKHRRSLRPATIPAPAGPSRGATP